jgi:molybdate transport system substrate-binding protein
VIICLIGLWVILLALVPAPAWAGEVRVAVTSSFFDTMTAVSEQFRTATGHQALLTEASSGELYAQILTGAPFDVYLASDQLDAKNLEDDGFAVSGTRFSYAVGRVTLWSPRPGRIGANGMETLRQGEFKTLAISNPRTNGYGQAAVQALKAMGLWSAVQERIVETENSRTAFQWVAGGKADLGLVPLGEVLDPDVKEKGSRWDVPEHFHTPVRQEAVLLVHGKDNPAALALLTFLRSDQARQTMQRFGYGIPSP